MQRKNRRRTRAHLLRELKRVLSNPGIRTFRHSLADRMIAQTKRSLFNELMEGVEAMQRARS